MLGSNPSADSGPKTEAGCLAGTPLRLFPLPRDWDQSDKSRGSGGWPPVLATGKMRQAGARFYEASETFDRPPETVYANCPIAQTNPASSRATATAATVARFPLLTIFTYFLCSLRSAFSAIATTSSGRFFRRCFSAPLVTGECR